MRRWIVLLLLLAACSAKDPGPQTTLDGVPFDPQSLTAAQVAGEVRVTPRGQQVFFQAPLIQSTQIIDLRAAGKELGIKLGSVEQIRVGYLFGVLDLPTRQVRHYLLFQSNFIEGHDRYAGVTLADGTPLAFTVSRAPDPCVPNCFPVMEALIVEIPDAAMRAQRTTGMGLLITVDTGQVIRVGGTGAYVSGYLQVIDAYPR
jgi:hypothetical protein